MEKLIVIVLSVVLVNNFILVRFLGLCPFLGVSREIKSSLSMGIAVIFVWTFVASLIVWSIIKATIGVRISEEEEYAGADIAECGVEAYPEFSRR